MIVQILCGLLFCFTSLKILAVDDTSNNVSNIHCFNEKVIREHFKKNLFKNSPVSPSLSEIWDSIEEYLADQGIEVEENDFAKILQSSTMLKPIVEPGDSQSINKSDNLPYSTSEIIKDIGISIVEAIAAGEALAAGSVAGAIALEIAAIDRAADAVKKMQENAKWKEEHQNTSTTNEEDIHNEFDYYDSINYSEVK